MGRVLRWLGRLLRGLVSLILPVFRKAKGPSGLAPGLRAALAVLVILLILVGLWGINQLPAVYQKIPKIPALAKFWLPILGLLFFTLFWLSYWLWRLLFLEDEGIPFPDVDQAWQEAMNSLRKAGLSIKDLPLFLILGQPEEEERALFQAAQLTLEVKQAPAWPEAPLYVYATRDAVYLTCAGASLTGYYALALAGKLTGTIVGPEGAPTEEDDFLAKTLTPAAKGAMVPAKVTEDMAKVLQQAEREGRAANQLTKAEKRELRCLYRQNQSSRSPMKNADLMAEQSARLQYLCRLVVRERQPYCAVNGILLLIPFGGTDSDQDATYAGDVLHRDLAVAGDVLKVDCPHFALVCDLETAPGFTEFVQRFSPRERLRRLGQSCPLTPDFRGNGRASEGSEALVGRMAASLAEWVCSSVVPTWVYHKFQVEKSEEEDRAALMRTNARLFLLSDALKDRSRRLALILSRALEARTSHGGPLLFGGCYLAGTGSDAGLEQAFVKGLMDRLLEGQSCVYWNGKTLREEAAYERWLVTGWTVLGLLILAGLAYGIYLYF